jgi:hypothetical protein
MFVIHYFNQILVCCCNTLFNHKIDNGTNNKEPNTPAAASVNNNPITTQNIIMVQTEAERLAAIATVATAAANV